MSITYIQLIGIIASIFAIISFQCNTKSVMLYLALTSKLLFGIHFLMMDALTAALMNFVICFRCYIFIQNRNIYWLFFFVVSFLILGIVSYQQWYSFFAILGTLIGTIAIWIGNLKKLRIMVLIAISSWFVHNFLINSYGGMLADILISLSIIIGILRFDIVKRMNKNTQNKMI